MSEEPYSRYHYLCERMSNAVFGKTSRKEIPVLAEIAGTELEKAGRDTSDQEIACLLDTLQYAGHNRYQPLIERYLAGPNEFLAAKALEVLCYFYDATEQYTDTIVGFMLGVPWDAGNDLRVTAISVADSYLRKHREPRLLSELTKIAEQDDNEFIREIARDTVQHALGELKQLHREPSPC